MSTYYAHLVDMWIEEVRKRDATVSELRAEIEALKVDNEFLRQMVRDANHNQDFDFTEAMGAKA